MNTKIQAETKAWSPDSWRSLPIKQQPIYDDKDALDAAVKTLSGYPALVAPSEIKQLKAHLADVCMGNGFLLQGGDCAESFAEFNAENLTAYFRVMMQMTVSLMFGAGQKVVKVGRVAGQFAKPRSADFEEKDGKKLPSYRGDSVNSIQFNEKSRKNDPNNLLRAYHQSTATLNLLRALAQGGEASLHNISKWNADFIKTSPQSKRFEQTVQGIEDALNFMQACGLSPDSVPQLHEADFYISHEGLLLPYEEAFTRQGDDGKYYACSAHFIWIGERTRALDEAHVEFFKGVENPIASKVGPTMKPDELVELIQTLNPNNEPGKLTLITRFGADKIEELLPPLVRKVKEEGLHVVWSCDPMHGNTIKSPNGYKTRPFNSVLAEVRGFFNVHEAEGTHAGGVHFEMTGQDVTECTGGAQAISEVDLKNRYHTHCDPRLNASQSLELAFLIGEFSKG